MRVMDVTLHTSHVERSPLTDFAHGAAIVCNIGCAERLKRKCITTEMSLSVLHIHDSYKYQHAKPKSNVCMLICFTVEVEALRTH